MCTCTFNFLCSDYKLCIVLNITLHRFIARIWKCNKFLCVDLVAYDFAELARSSWGFFGSVFSDFLGTFYEDSHFICT